MSIGDRQGKRKKNGINKRNSRRQDRDCRRT